MKKSTLFFSLIVLFFSYSCGGGSTDKTKNESKKSGIYEPTTQEEFVKILDELNIKPYPGAVISGFEHSTDGALTYKVAAEGNSNKAIIDYYKTAFEKAMKGKTEWKFSQPLNTNFMYTKGMYELIFSFYLTSQYARYEMQGGDPKAYEGVNNWTYSIGLGDNANSY